MKNLKDLIIEKLKVTKNISNKPFLVDKNIVCCTIEFNSSFGEQHWILESGLYMQLIEDIIV